MQDRSPKCIIVFLHVNTSVRMKIVDFRNKFSLSTKCISVLQKNNNVWNRFYRTLQSKVFFNFLEYSGYVVRCKWEWLEHSRSNSNDTASTSDYLSQWTKFRTLQVVCVNVFSDVSTLLHTCLVWVNQISKTNGFLSFFIFGSAIKLVSIYQILKSLGLKK